MFKVTKILNSTGALMKVPSMHLSDCPLPPLPPLASCLLPIALSPLLPLASCLLPLASCPLPPLPPRLTIVTFIHNIE
ncbi:MAG: hypothetical protein EYR95_15080 [Phormidium sp. SL48-SHIP]|nr:MAG: hypothetical protein EYR95_15080 [Phormidium sp. SL48-SHIP]